MSAYYKRCDPISFIAQGDIYKDIEKLQFNSVSVDEDGEIAVDGVAIIYDYCVVLTQACDLEQDYKLSLKRKTEQSVNDDKVLPTILMAPAYLGENLRAGTHLEEQGLVMQHINSKDWKAVQRNRNARYHFLKSDLDLNIPELAIDFKHYFTVDRSLLYNNIDGRYSASLAYLHRELLSQRFCNYLSRIGLPESPVEVKSNFDSLLKVLTPVEGD